MTYLLWLMKSSLSVHAATAFTHNILAKHMESTASTDTGHWHIAYRTVMTSRGHRTRARASFTWLAAGLSGSDASADPAATSTSRARARGWVQVTPCAADHCGSETKILPNLHTFLCFKLYHFLNETWSTHVLVWICYVHNGSFCLYI